ncbi:DUF2116 family Zn-ribbon domain-containing protein [Citrobacter freundii]|nr:DUF2116 family Zn-ribbon domain-containing protein [Citrobacter freundii]HCM58017.1 hypothetical protein [Citrobacter freundii]
MVKWGFVLKIQLVQMITKPCPYCGKLITPESLVCSHCRKVNPFVKASRREKAKNVLVIALVASFLIWIIL